MSLRRFEAELMRVNGRVSDARQYCNKRGSNHVLAMCVLHRLKRRERALSSLLQGSRS